ncbi:MAG: hypothetical protein M3540_10045, partial [Actinomycetota bacterium]|nr:hypothetical protein [Actinomycetota bacterium]
MAAVFASTPALAATPVRWCGGGARMTGDRIPDAVTARQIHVIYAVAADGQDRFDSVAAGITTDLLAIDEWWRREDPTRTPRFDLFAYPACESRLGLLDLSFLRLPQPATFYRADGGFGSMIDGVRAAGFVDEHKKYMVFYDGDAGSGVCGLANFGLPRDGGAASTLVVWLRSYCPDDLGAGRFQASVVAHELLHLLGALAWPFPSPGPPNACPDQAHTCDSPVDLLYGRSTDLPLEFRMLDPGHDDYYAHSSSWWDVRDSDWLAHLDAPQFPLRVSIDGPTEVGMVRTNLPGIICPPACEGEFEAPTRVELRAQEWVQNRFFDHWDGACKGAAPCAVTLDAARAVTVHYAAPTKSLTVGVKGRGRVASVPAGIACPGVC